MRAFHAASIATACAVLCALLSSSAAHAGIPAVTAVGQVGQTVFGGRRLLQADLPPAMLAPGTMGQSIVGRRLLQADLPPAMLAPGTVGQSVIGRRLAQLLMPGPFVAGGWSDVDADESFQTLVKVFNYATMVLPGLNANDMSKGGTYQLCSAKQQVVAGTNYLLSLSRDCGNAAAAPTNITVYRSLDGQFEITDMALGEDVGSRRRNLMQAASGLDQRGRRRSGGWSKVDTEESFQSLANVFNYASLVHPKLNSNGASTAGYQLCSAKQQVVAGMNYVLTVSRDCASAGAERITMEVYQSLDGQYNLVSMT